ncbi:MAG: lmo0937 family membrane protein [Bacillota bacterium]
MSLWTIALVLTVLWLFGLITSTTFSGLIHILLVIAVVMILLNFLGRRNIS